MFTMSGNDLYHVLTSLTGFGLMVPPVIHRVLTAAGIKDCSATIEGSRNPMQVLKATIQLLHSGVR